MAHTTKHRPVKLINSRGKEENFNAHRDGSYVWLTQDAGDRFVRVMEHVFEFVSQAKAWMNTPTRTVE